MTPTMAAGTSSSELQCFSPRCFRVLASSSQLTLSFRGHGNKRFRSFRVGATAASGREDDFERIAREVGRAVKTVAGKAEILFSDIKQKAQDFHQDKDLERKARQFTRDANQRIEEIGFEFQRNAGKLNKKYKFTQMGREFADYVKDQLQAVDSQLRIRQRARSLSLDVRRNWPTYRRQVLKFLDTPLGKVMSTLLFVWFVLSGWIFRAFVLSMWLLPIAAPLLIGTIARNTLVEGACPNCKTQFIGSRKQVTVCRSCGNVVWKPRDDFTKEDASIIDIDVDKQ